MLNQASITKRIYLLIPDLNQALDLIRLLWESGLANRGLHLMVKPPNQKELRKLLDLGVSKTSDLLGSLARGAFIGGVAGLIAGFLIVQFLSEEISLGWGSIAGICIFGIFFGAWSSSLIGVSVPNPVVEKIRLAAKEGGIIMMVDVSPEKEQEIDHLIKANFAEILMYGVEVSSTPVLPKDANYKV